jgi:hypothetical protein
MPFAPLCPGGGSSCAPCRSPQLPWRHCASLARIRPGAPGYERFICVGGPNAYGFVAGGVAIAGDGSIWVAGQAEQRAVLQTVNAW